MTDMTIELVQTAPAKSTAKSSGGSKKTVAADGESFSEKLDRAVSEANENTASQQQEEQSEEIGSEMAAETLVDFTLMPIIPTTENAEQPVLTGDSLSLNADGAPIGQNVTVEALPSAEIPATEQTQIPAQQPQQAVQPDQSGSAVEKQPLPIQSVTVEQTPAQQPDEQPIDHLQAQTQFTKSIQQAQHLIRNTDSATSLRSQPLKIDVDELQKQVDAGEFLSQQQAAGQQIRTEQPQPEMKNAENVEPREIFPQIRQGAQQHIEQGDSDFTIKLRPEGLGEITVKLASQDGRVTLSLSASDANVQKLLGSEINSLREIMRPYNVEVAQVEQSNSAVFADLQQQLQQHDSPQQNFSGQRNSFFANSFEEAVAEEEAVEEQSPDSILDRYI